VFRKHSRLRWRLRGLFAATIANRQPRGPAIHAPPSLPRLLVSLQPLQRLTKCESVLSQQIKTWTRYQPVALCILAAALVLVAPNSHAQLVADVPQTLSNTTPISVLHPTISAVSLHLQRVSEALRATRSARILAIGSSSTAGVGASSPSRTYEARLESDLEDAIKGSDFQVVGHGLSGELAQGAADRMKREVVEVRPDLVIWQVGTNDAMRHVVMDDFKNCINKTIGWLKEQKIDVILINPQYGDTLVKDSYYEEVVTAIGDIARKSQVLLVDRFDAMRKLQHERGSHVDLSDDDLHMNDEGYRRLAEQLAATIIRSLPHQSAANVAAAPR
jgi:acyl-CoA thioesterase I